jgi:Ca2+-binding RTX toxin-like protein
MVDNTGPSVSNPVTGTSGSDHLHGTNGSDMLAGGAGVDYMYGGAGNDSFVIKLSDMDSTLNSATSTAGKSQDYIYDFGGAGGWAASNNDFISLTGFGAGSTMKFDSYASASDHTMQYYTIHSTTTGQDYQIFVHSTNGQLLSTAKGDFNFYG